MKKIKTINIDKLQQENRILRENAEHNDKVVDKFNWENQLLKKENKQLKEEKRKVINQQKEFIEWLTSYIELLNNKPDLIEESEIDLLKEILSKYKETIGVSNE